MLNNVIMPHLSLTVEVNQSWYSLVVFLAEEEQPPVTLNCVLCPVVFGESGATPQLAWNHQRVEAGLSGSVTLSATHCSCLSLFFLSLSLQVTAEDRKKDDDDISDGKSCSFAMPGPPVHVENNLHCTQILGCQNGQKLINLVLLEMMNVLKVVVIGLLEQHLCSSSPINVIRNICIARLHSIHASIGWPRHFEEDRTEIMLYDNQPIPCLLSAPVQLLSNTCSLSQRTTIAQQQRRWPSPPQLFDQTSRFEKSLGAEKLYVCVFSLESVSVCVCLLLCSACIEIVGVSEWEYGCACALTLCHYVGVWPIWLTVFQIMIRVQDNLL